MYRISTEFDLRTWKDIFGKLHVSGMRRIVYVPTELAGFVDLLRETLVKTKIRLQGNKPVFSGWLYSENEFLEMFQPYYRIEKRVPSGRTAIYLLERSKPE